MKKDKFFINALLAAVVMFFNSSAFAQKNVLPAGVTENSTVEEILKWLDQTSFSQARIGLDSKTTSVEPSELATSSPEINESAIFSKGFRLAKTDECSVVLRNDEVKLLQFTSNRPDSEAPTLAGFRKNQDKQPRLTGDLFFSLKYLKADEAPYRQTKNTGQSDLFGTWRTGFTFYYDSAPVYIPPSKEKLKKLRESILANIMRVEIPGTGPNGVSEKMRDDILTFTFDDKKMSEDFYAAMRRAITLCREK